METSLPPSLPVAERPRRPEWMKVRAPSKDGAYFDVQKLVHGLSLNTICEEARCPNISECWGRGTATVEVLTPDFLGVEDEALRTVLGARPEVFNFNIETVRRLHRQMRGAKASYDGALWLLARAKEIADYNVLTKSSIIVGLGETND